MILEAEQEVARLESAFAAPDFHIQHGHEWQALEAKLQAAREQVPRLYARWEELERIKAAAE